MRSIGISLWNAARTALGGGAPGGAAGDSLLLFDSGGITLQHLGMI